MKKLLFVVLSICILTSWALAAEPAPTAPAVTAVTLKGDIIDNMCARANEGNLPQFVKTHTKECAVACAGSGYSLVSGGKVYAFDALSNVNIQDFLKKSESKLQVEVEALQMGDQLSLISIKNQ